MKILRYGLVLFFLIVTGLSLDVATTDVHAKGTSLFGSTELNAGSPWEWRKVLMRIRKERRIFATCVREPERCQSDKMRAWAGRIESLRGRAPLEQLRAINGRANEQPYITDAENFGRDDYYASPLEFLVRSGDCEDFAIFKYFALTTLGFADASLRIVLVERVRNRTAHAVLAVYLGQEIYILDNETDGVLPHAAIRGYRPLFSFNAARGWSHHPALRGASAKVRP